MADRRVDRAPLAGWMLLIGGLLGTPAYAGPFIPAHDGDVLAELPAGTRHADLGAQRLARARLDIAVPLAKFYIEQSRRTGDLRYLGYAEATLVPWVSQSEPAASALVLQATIEQSRHEFNAALASLNRALASRPGDAQALLTRATILRVVGRYSEASIACAALTRAADGAVGLLCDEGLKGLTGSLGPAYAALVRMPIGELSDPERAWRDSELGEMAVRLGRIEEAERWFEAGLALNPLDFYQRAAYADLLLRQHRDLAAIALLKGEDSIEPLLLRLAIAQQRTADPALAHTRELLRAAFAAEERRGEAVHRREQARFLLDVEQQPVEALDAARANWQLQREPDDALILIEAARAAGRPESAQPALEFARAAHLEDVRWGAASATPAAGRS